MEKKEREAAKEPLKSGAIQPRMQTKDKGTVVAHRIDNREQVSTNNPYRQLEYMKLNRMKTKMVLSP